MAKAYNTVEDQLTKYLVTLTKTQAYDQVEVEVDDDEDEEEAQAKAEEMEQNGELTTSFDPDYSAKITTAEGEATEA